MDAVEYLKARHRLCAYYIRNNGNCAECVMRSIDGNLCQQLENANPEKAVYTIEDWLKRHPPKTRQGVFLERYPDAETLGNGVLRICPKLIEHVECIYYGDDGFTDCTTCLRKYWYQEIDGDE